MNAEIRINNLKLSIRIRKKEGFRYLYIRKVVDFKNITALLTYLKEFLNKQLNEGGE